MAMRAAVLTQSSNADRNAAIEAYKRAHPEASFSQIGAQFGVSRNTVAGVLDRAVRRRRGAAADRCRRRARAEREARILAWRRAGPGPDAIAKAERLSPWTVIGILRRAGVPCWGPV